MKEADRSKKELIAELHALRRRLAELEAEATSSGHEVPLLDVAERRWAEEALRESGQQFRAVFEKSGVGMTLCDLEDHYIQTNLAFQAMVGYTEAELLGTTFWDITHPDDIAQEREAIEKVFEEVAFPALRYEKRYLRKDGEPIWVRLTASRVLDDEGVHRYGFAIVEDITTHKQAEEALRKSEARNRALVQAIPDAMFRMDRDGVYLDFVPAEGFETAYLPEEFLGQPVHEILPAEITEAAMHCIGEALRTRQRQRFEYDWVNDEQRRHYEARVVPDAVDSVLAIVRDITERKQAEDALRTSKHFVDRIVRAAPSFIYVIDIVNERYVYVNDTYERVLGYPRARVLADDGYSFMLSRLHPDDLKHMMDRQRSILERMNSHPQLIRRDDVYDFVYRVKDADDRWHWIQSWGVVFETTDEDQVLQVLGVAEDITERKGAEAERERLIEELEAKNAELERFTYTVSHDLKSPLVTIKGFLGLLEQDAVDGEIEKIKQDIEQISRAANKMQRLLDELLELSRIGRLMNPPEAVLLTDLAREAVEQVAGQIAARGVEVEIASTMPVVVGDRVRLLEVLQNLIDNAVKYMGDQPAPRIEVEGKQEELYVRCTVCDNGIGIEPRFHDKVFGLFERLDAASDGTGIGLALAKRIVEVHGGHIGVESEGHGHGATFFFTLPQRKES